MSEIQAARTDDDEVTLYTADGPLARLTWEQVSQLRVELTVLMDARYREGAAKVKS